MKIVWRVLLVILIIVPIFMCWRSLEQIWKVDDDFNVDEDNNEIITSGDIDKMIDMISEQESGNMIESSLGDGVSYDVTGISPISKVYENAEVSISIANIYQDHDENSEALAKLNKGEYITVQNYDNGWSRVTNYTTSGWMKTANIKLPDSDNNMNLVQPGETNYKIGTVKVEDSLNVRASAKDGAVISSLTNGKSVSIIDDTTVPGWYQVKVDAITGWVSADYIVVNN